MVRRPPTSPRTYTLVPDTTLFRSVLFGVDAGHARLVGEVLHPQRHVPGIQAPGRGRVEQGEAVERAPELRVEAERILRLGLVVDVAAQGQQAAPERDAVEIGRASCRERVCQYV